MLNFTTHEVSGVLIITFEPTESFGPERQPTAERESLYKAVETRGDVRFAVDLGSIEYLSSADIGFLIALKRRIERRQGKVVLYQVNPFIINVFQTMRLDHFFEIAADWNGALRQLPHVKASP